MSSSHGGGRDILHRSEAEARARRVVEPEYDLRFWLDDDVRTYRGEASVSFGLRSTEEPLFIDFSGRLQRLEVNGQEAPVEHHGHRIWLAPDQLAEHNRIVARYENAYDTSGDGFHRFVDPEDGSTYVFSDFEPFSAHRLFPCFDQPDLKARYQLRVTAPTAWRVVSTDRPVESRAIGHGRVLHVFPMTAPLATYVFSLIAGPWAAVEADHKGLPLGLLGRASMRRQLDEAAAEIFEITTQGIDHYEGLFGRRYPFGKYDQIFVPEFNAGAMENAGAVTFNDGYLFRDPPTYAQRLMRAEVVLHELAHMWFGDLVTMRWWDDLWLNETFATYLSYRCLAEATRFRDAWQVFNGQMRPLAYHQDQLATTHPIAAVVEHTDQAVGNFDGITYEKGAAVIKQLVAYLGDDAFVRGLRDYVARHEWANATLADFLAALADASGSPLEMWAGRWLGTASLNTIAARWEVADGRISSMVLEQGVLPGHDVLRPHATTLGLVGPDASGALSVRTFPALIEGVHADVPAAVGQPAPVFVFPNHGDHDYAIAELDPVSLAFALEHISDLPEPLLRQQVWSTLWEMVRAARLSSLGFLETVRRFAPGETDRALVQAILDRAAVATRRYVPEAQSAAIDAAMTGMAIDSLRGTDDPDLRIVWARGAVAFVSDADQLGSLLALADGTWQVEDFEPDQQLRWRLGIKAVAYGLPEGLDRIDDELARDPSDRGQRAALQARVGRADAEVKAVAWSRINGEGYGSDYLTRAAIAGFQWPTQRELLWPYRDAFYEQLARVYATRDHTYAQSYLRWLVPDRWAEPAELERLRAYADGLERDQGLLQRHVTEIADDLERDIRVQAIAARTLSTR